MGYDSRFKRVFLTKLDYLVKPEYVGKLEFVFREGFEEQDVNLDFLPAPIKINGLSYEISTTDNRAYYALEAVHKDKVSNRLQIHINTIVDNTKLMGVYSE